MTAHTPTPPAAPSAACLDILGRLVAFDTTSRLSNLALVDWVESRLVALGMRPWRSWSPDRSKASLFATLGPDRAEGGLILSGHTDVVPAGEPDWTTDPFVLTPVGDRLQGRGTTDMKGFLAAILAVLERIEPARLTRPLHVVLSHDEEVGCKGVPALIAEMIRRGLRPTGCVVGEPTAMRVVGAHKGAMAFEVRVTGRSVHSSLAPLGVNAVEYAARLVEHIRQTAVRMAAEETRDRTYEIPHSTLQTGVIQGGTAGNVLPQECSFRFDMRFLPATSGEALLAGIRAFADEVLIPEMRRTAPEASIVIDRRVEVPAFAAKGDGAFFGSVRAASGHEAGGSVSFGTEAGFFQQAGIPTVICGPGDMRDAHCANESIRTSELAACEGFLGRLLAPALAPQTPPGGTP